ncbi:hypothetical protein [Carboxylicivirga sp. RSCT41]|uniref:hypothetical protein n=1 Tax=Carboxylicivirga agarovorans TaxID=3417570 RepID=UPI003D351788
MNKSKKNRVLPLHNHGYVYNAQEKQQELNTRFGLTASLQIQSIDQNAQNDYIYSITPIPQLVGLYAQHKNTEASIDLGFNYLGGRLNYTFFRNFGLEAGISTAIHSVTIESDNYGYHYNEYAEENIGITQYYGGLSYKNKLFERLTIRIMAKARGIETEPFKSQSSIIPQGQYVNYNKRALRTDIYELNPSLVYGGNIYLELLPRPSMNRSRPLVPFCNISIMGNNTSNTHRELKIEEWIQGNVVYYESPTKQNLDYDLYAFQVQAGLKWYLRY